MSAKTRMAFRELTEAAKETARRRLLGEMERFSWHERAIAQFVSDAKAAGISVIAESIRFSEDGASFSASGVDLPVVLDRSGIGSRFLSSPGCFALFCSFATAEIRQTYPFSSDARLLSVSVELGSFDNNADEQSFVACYIAAIFLERYLKNLAASLSVRLYELLSAERERMASCDYLDGILLAMGSAFLKNGDWAMPSDKS